MCVCVCVLITYVIRARNKCAIYFHTLNTNFKLNYYIHKFLVLPQGKHCHVCHECQLVNDVQRNKLSLF